MSFIKENIKEIVLVCSAIPLVFINTPFVYAYLIAFTFGIFAYSKSEYEFNYSKNTRDVLDYNINPLNYMIIIVYTIVMGGFMFILAYISSFNNYSLFIAVTIVSGLISIYFLNKFKNTYKRVYNYSIPTPSSRKYVLPSKVAIIFAFSVILVMREITLVAIIALLIPPVLYYKFTRYMSRTKDSTYGNNHRKFIYINNENLSNRNSAQGSLKPLVNDLQYNHGIDDQNNAKLNVCYSVELPNDKDLSKGPLVNYAKTVHYTSELIDSMKTLENTDMDDVNSYKEYYEDVARLIVFEMIKRKEKSYRDIGIPFDEIPKDFAITMIRMVAESDEYTMDDLDISNSDLIQMYDDSDKKLKDSLMNNMELDEQDDDNDDEDFDYIDL